MKKALVKDSIRQIKNTFKRFLSIVLIVFLGVGFFAGIRATSPDMKDTVDTYYDLQDVMDIEVLSTLGLTQNDIEALKNVEGTNEVEGSYSFDATVSNEEKEFVIKVKAMPENINKIKLMNGNFPQNNDEAVVEESFLIGTGYKIGDYIELNPEKLELGQDENTDVINEKKIKIVGVVESPEYISRSRGTSKLGAGSINYYMFIPRENINMDVYTAAYITVDGAKELATYNQDYKDLVSHVKDNVEAISEERKQARYNEIIEEANKKLDDAQNEYNDKKQEAEEKINDAENQIEDAKRQIRNAQTTLENNIASTNNKFKEADNQIKEAESQIQNAKTQLENQRQQIEMMPESQEKEYAKQQLEMATKQIEQNETNLNNQKAELEINKKKAEDEFASARRKIENSKTEISENESKLEESRKEANEKLEEAQQKINDAREEVNKIEKPTWYILDRNSNYGYAEYIQDTDRIANIAKVFPVVFFLVAALISLTSMSRMIEEQRTQIGTLKALGYNKAQISMKYIIYALLATIIGGVTGMCVGFKLLPRIITMMYQMMYTLPDADCVFRLKIGIVGLVFALVCTIGATIYTCIKELIEKPATLMLPKAPTPGKRILLEKITFIWKRMKFTNKVTARNLFRYKKKFLMTVIGVAGCTSLIIAGFGIRNAIGNMIPDQFGEIFKYEGTVSLKDDLDLEEIAKEENKVKDIEKVSKTLTCYMTAVETTQMESTQTINLMVTDKIDDLKEFVNLRARNNKKNEYTLGNDSVIISEKLAKLLNANVGDKITIKDTDDIEKTVTVGNITENYIYHYMYMSSDLYNSIYGENEYKPNTILIKEEQGITLDEEDDIGKTILADENNVVGVTFLSSTKDVFSMVMDKMQLVVYILIIAAGLLAFAVLYNLSNVNISERIRELATIKVLGFYNKEVFNYVAKETRILTIIGILLGLLGGYFLAMYAVKTCELDMLMFDYNIGIMSFIYGIVITIVFAEIVNIAVNRTLKKISMTESLKSID